ncbi:MAG TPA: hypothetical protein VGM03_10640, partial [Phycisphaerae bacterium]
GGVSASFPASAVYALIGYNGELIAGGYFNTAGGTTAVRIARWNGSSWWSLGSGMNTNFGWVSALAVYNGELIAGGNFTMAGDNVSLYWARWNCEYPAPALIDIAAADPPNTNPYDPALKFRDVLQDTTTILETQGIGVFGTPSEGPYDYATISVTFSGAPSPAPTPANIGRSCTDLAGNGQSDCPVITGVTGGGSGPYYLTLSSPPPVRECITFTFAGTNQGQKLQYQVLPGDTNLDGIVSTQDLLFLVQRISDGTANLPENFARFNINRSQETGGNHVNTQDLLRLVQLLNGTNATQAFNGATVADCP